METTIGQRWEVYDFNQVSNGVPKAGEMVCVHHPTDWPDDVIFLVGNGKSPISELYNRWLDPETETRLIEKMKTGNASTLAAAKNHTDAEVGSEAAARKQGDIDTLAAAKSHTDDAVGAEAEARKQGDADTLALAKSHTDDAVNAEAEARKQGDADILAAIKEFKDNPAANINDNTITDAMIGERLVENPAEQEGSHSRKLTQMANDSTIALRDLRAALGGFTEFSSRLKTYLADNTVRCPQTGRLGKRFQVRGLAGGTSMTESWNNNVPNVFGANGTLGVHTNTTFWNAQLIDRGIAASAVAIRRSANGTGSNIDIYPRYTSGALGNARASTIVSFFMASDETNAELGGLFGNNGGDTR